MSLVFKPSGDGITTAEAKTAAKGLTGWASYIDGTYTSGNPLIISQGLTSTITVDSASTITTHLPDGVTSFWDEVNNKITPDNEGDAYVVRIDFTAFTDNQNGVAEIILDIGGTIGAVFSRTITFPRGTGSTNAREISNTNLVYTLGTFIANGGTFSLESISGTTSIYDIVITISRIHAAEI